MSRNEFTRIGIAAMVMVSILFSMPKTVAAQSFAGVDLTTMNVDDLTDEQLLNYISQAQDRGITQKQLELLARERGVSEADIVKLRLRLEGLKNRGPQNSSKELNNLDGRENNVVDQSPVGKSSFSERTYTEDEQLIFGFDLFKRSNLSFAPNLSLPTPSDYQLGPGDELIVDLWGATEQFFNFRISPEGTIRPKNVGPIYVNGLTIEKATERIISRLSQIYNGLNESDQSSSSIFYQVRLGDIRTINIDVVGSVEQPGTYAIPSLATVYTALHAAGGPNSDGTFRNIILIRNNKRISSIDIYSFLTDGVRSGDVRLRNGDVIMVNPYERRVSLQGEVRRPGYFELKDEENMKTLFNFAKGFKNTAFESLVTVKRNGSTERELIDIPMEQFSTFYPKDGDEILIGKILERFSNRITIDGAVYRGGEYELKEGMTLTQLIQNAGGLRGDAFMNRATIFRIDSQLSQLTIPVNLRDLMTGDVTDIRLMKEDIVKISSIYDLNEEYYVQVNGEVQRSGTYPYFKQMTIQDLIVLSGGIKDSGSNAVIEISRRNKNSTSNRTAEIITISINESLGIDAENSELKLEPYDQIFVRRSPGYSVQQQVIVEGEVTAPGTYTISRKDERISDLISRAKGLTPFAYSKGAILIRKSEFSESEINDQISQQYLKNLRNRILDSESELKSEGRGDLLSRLDQIESGNLQNSINDREGSRLKREIIEQTSEQDSLLRDIKIDDSEPVALDLEKILASPGSKYDFFLKAGDVISIPGVLETVRITGEVTSTLNVRYDKGYNFKDYINRSGGFLTSAKRNGSYVQYPNGERKGVKGFLFFKNYPKIEPGSTIFVKRKPERKGLGAQGWIGISTGLATIGLVVVQAIRLTN